MENPDCSSLEDCVIIPLCFEGSVCNSECEKNI